jgi:hypothetical protein
MDILDKVEEYYKMKKDKISKLTNNKIQDFTDFQVIFDDYYYSKDLVVYESDKKILVGKYEILGYSNNNKWTWASDNKYIEKYLTNISKKVQENVKDKDILKNPELLLKYSLYYSNKIWIIKRNINFNPNLNEYIIITDINQIV